MKQGFWGGVIVTFIGGLLVVAATTVFQNWRESRKAVIGYVVDNEAVILDSELSKILGSMKVGKTISTVRIINNGRDDLAPLNVGVFDKISPDGTGIDDFGIWKIIGEKTERPIIEKGSGRLNVKFSLLRPGEGVDVWISNKGYSMFDVRNVQPGLDVEEIDADDEWDFGFVEFMILLGAVLASFIGGAMAAETANNHMLKKVGFDPKELLEAYNSLNKKSDK